jgi:hypothetical protein
MNVPDQSTKMTYEVPRGHAVHRPDNEEQPITFIKAERQGTDYIHHYLIQISPACDQELALVYIDPEELLVDTGTAPTFDLSQGEMRENPAIGDIFQNIHGTYLKVVEDPKSQKMFAFVDITSGEIKRRQERGVRTVYSNWMVT